MCFCLQLSNQQKTYFTKMARTITLIGQQTVALQSACNLCSIRLLFIHFTADEYLFYLVIIYLYHSALRPGSTQYCKSNKLKEGQKAIYVIGWSLFRLSTSQSFQFSIQQQVMHVTLFFLQIFLCFLTITEQVREACCGACVQLIFG